MDTLIVHTTKAQAFAVCEVFAKLVGYEDDGTPIWEVPAWCEVLFNHSH